MDCLKKFLQKIALLIVNFINALFNKKKPDGNSGADTPDTGSDEPTTEPAAPEDENGSTDEPETQSDTTDEPTAAEPEPAEPAEEIPVFGDLNIAVVTDIHEDTTSLNSLLPKISGQDLTICLGDLIHRDSSNDNALTKIKNIANIVKIYDGSEKIFCKGNHDNNTNNGAGYLSESQLSDKSLYGYKDFDNAGVRVIYVNTSDYDLIHGDTGKCGDKYSYDLSWNNTPYITLKQLAAIAEYMRTTPKYYSVLLAGHYPTLGAGSWAQKLDGENLTDLYDGLNRIYGFSVKPLISLIRAFKNRQKARIAYDDFKVVDSNYFWNCGATNETVLCHLSNDPVSNDSTAIHTDDVIPDEDKLGYIDVDFTENTTNNFIAYFHGHTHNYTCCSAHKLDGDGAPIKDFLEIGFPAVNSTRNKGESNWNAFGSDYFGGEGCDDKYGIADNKSVTAGGHASVVKISSTDKTISVKDYSLNGNGFSRSGTWSKNIELRM